jgi:hypothetical protein
MVLLLRWYKEDFDLKKGKNQHGKKDRKSVSENEPY